MATLFVGYAGYYICRMVLPTVSVQFKGDESLHINNKLYGELGAIGLYCYALGKLLNGIVAEYVGGRTIFLLGMFLSLACVILFASSSTFWIFAVIWGANRFVQSMGWNGLVQVTCRWFRHRTLATVMGVLSLSYLFGDALARLYLGLFVAAGLGWREVMFVAAATLGVIAVIASFTLKRSPSVLGMAEPPPPPLNVHGNASADVRISLRSLLAPLLASRMFWLVCAMNMGLTAIRESFNYWTPLYLEQSVGVDPRNAGLFSSLFPFCGAVASLVAGYSVDRLGGKYGRVILPLTFTACIALFLLATADLKGQTGLALTLLCSVALFVMGPYTFCSGVLAMNIGGKRAGAAAAGMIDAGGYLCGAVVTDLVGILAEKHGFAPVLNLLMGLGVVTFIIAIGYWYVEERRSRAM